MRPLWKSPRLPAERVLATKHDADAYLCQCRPPHLLSAHQSLTAGGPGAAMLAASAGGRLTAGALLRLFDNFWDSGTPRVGERGALGWRDW
jgi:hypothetical protein